ncbi:FKBP-type peptidyl-prolyl cis-trans isomerase [Actinocorallia lasiicapitis]
MKGEFGDRPEVEFPKDAKPGEKLALTTLIKGEGAQVAEGDLVIAKYVGYSWNASSEPKLIGSSYQGAGAGAFPSWNVVPGLKKAFTSAKVGSRVVAVIPPKDGYGDKGSQRLQISGSDSLVYVLDVMATYPKGAAVADPKALDEPGLPTISAARVPEIGLPKGSPPSKLTVRTVKEGAGPSVKGGQLLAIQYVGALWRDGKVFSSSWADGKVYATVIGAGQVIKGWDEGLVGQKVGSRLLVVAPPDKAYGAKDMEVKGLPNYGIKANDTLVYVVDVLGAF